MTKKQPLTPADVDLHIRSEKEVEEFNPADYAPGQIVDIQTARKLHAAGGKLQFKGVGGNWFVAERVDESFYYRVSLLPE